MTTRFAVVMTFAALLAGATPALAAPVALVGCVPALKDVRTGSGAKTFASHYVTAGTYGYGEFVAGLFGGQSLWQKRGGRWCRIETTTTVLDRKGLLSAGIPGPTADTLLARMRAGRELAPPGPRH
jgi:tetrahydromethanopterin S-methyltransferase subunit D